MIMASQRPRKHPPAAAWCVSPSPAAVWRAQLDKEAPAAAFSILEPLCGRASRLLLSSADKRCLRTQPSPGSHSCHARSQDRGPCHCSAVKPLRVCRPRQMFHQCNEERSLAAGYRGAPATCQAGRGVYSRVFTHGKVRESRNV